MSKDKKKRVVLLDAHAILHRAYHALPDFKSEKGDPTGALYGLSAMLLKAIKDLKPDYIFACYDLPKPTFRHKAYKEYKAGRGDADDELVSQIIKSKDFFKAFSVPIHEKEGFEADDLLGTIADKLKSKNNLEIFIATGDMDALQLVDGKKVQVYTLKKGIKDTIIYDEEAVKERFGFGPELLPDYKGLRGDPSDNIKGIKGIGDKTATILIKEFGTIENLYKELKKGDKKFLKAGVKERIVGLLKEGEKDAKFSKMLGEIKRDALDKFDLPVKEWKQSLNTALIKDIFEEHGFRSLWKRAGDLFGVAEESNKATKQPARHASQGEAGGESKQSSFLARQSLGVGGNEVGEKVDQKEIKEVALALWLIDSEITNPSIDDILNYAKTKSFKNAKEKILKEIKERGQEYLYKKIELPLLPVIEKMEKKGIKVDKKYLKNLSEKYHKELEGSERKIWNAVGQEFNINSPKQLSEMLFDKLELHAKNLKKTAGGARSTRESELLKLKDTHPVIDEILKYREYQKLLSTYIDNIPSMLDENNRLHTNLVQTGTTTGRMSSTNPNLQNIPTRTDLGNAIRTAFISEKGHKLVAFDYSQIELRTSAILSEDKKLLRVFKEGKDIHSVVASEVFGVPEDKIDKEMRRRAKIINFGILYGMGVNSLRQSLGTNRAEAQEFQDNYFKSFKDLKRYLEKTKEIASKKGYTETLFGRRRYFEGINSKLPFIRAMAERMAINAPIQGTAADVAKLAMVRVNEFLKKEKLENEVFLLLQIHDELVFEIKESLVEEICPKIEKIMEDVLTPEQSLGIKMETNVCIGENLGELK